MNCEKYQNLISAFLDNDLDLQTSKEVQSHLTICAECAKTHEDFASILDFSDEMLSEESAPPNSQALWCRINNIIETDIQPELASEKVAMEPKQGILSRFWNSTWQLSPWQAMSSVLGIALISSLLTIVGIKNFSGPYEIHSEIETQPNLFEIMLSKVGIVETPEQKNQRRLQERKSAIAYWEKRVELKKAKWDSHLKGAFDRNLKEINKVLIEYTRSLQENPRDKISTEMLDSTLSEKMEFLREFAEL